MQLPVLKITNFIHLDQTTLLYILKWRNSAYVKTWMDDKFKISAEEHLKFCCSLKKDNLKKYYYITIDDTPYGVADFKAVNGSWNCCEIGNYTFGDQKYSMSQISSCILYYIIPKLKISKVLFHVKNDNLKALLQFIMHKVPGAALISKDDQYHYFEDYIEWPYFQDIATKTQSKFNIQLID